MVIGMIMAGLLIGSLMLDNISSLVSGLDTDPIEGTDGDDVLTGSEGNDLLIGHDGDDTLEGNGGNDRLSGGGGSDTLDGGSGNDVLTGSSGSDILDGGEGNDVLSGDSWSDVIYGNTGDDTVNGGGGSDLMHGGQGDDILNGGVGDDIIYGGTGDDTLHGGKGDDELIGANVFSRDFTLEDLVELQQTGDTSALTPAVTIDFTSDNSGADILLGEAGEDFMLLGAGDTATGGADADTFVAYEYPADSTGQSTITDYVDGTDQIQIMHPADEDAPEVTVSSTANGDAVVLLNGEPTVVVTGAGGTLTAGDIGLVAS